MSKVKMMSPAVPNMPWQDRAEGKTTGAADATIWRYRCGGRTDLEIQ